LKLTNLIENNPSNLPHKAFVTDVIAGLSAQPKSISAKYFYDDVGSELFQKISQHQDYYPTKTEYAILDKISTIIPEMIHTEEIDIIELGAGDGHKSKLIIEGFLGKGCKVNFYPIDISEKAMQLLGDNLSINESLHIHGVVADYFHGLNHLKKISSNKKLVVFLGSNIGNFTKTESNHFLEQLGVSLNAEDYALIGFDLVKNPQVLNQAYNDSEGLTEAFNINLLSRINRELGGNFDTSKFQHYGFYNPKLRTMESYLISLANQHVEIKQAKQTFHFEKFEAMHLEYSHKYFPSDITHLANHNGFNVVQHFSDEKDYFIDALWQVKEAK
jgi:L-histidine Nalpha-methyltransferase